MKDHWIFLLVIGGAIIIAWFHYQKDHAPNAVNR